MEYVEGVIMELTSHVIDGRYSSSWVDQTQEKGVLCFEFEENLEY
jgi:hypothetical protein